MDGFRWHQPKQFGTEHERTKNRQQGENVDYFSVRPQSFTQRNKNYHPNNRQIESQLKFDCAISMPGSQMMPLQDDPT